MAESKAAPKTECTALLSSRTSKTSKSRANYDRLACCYDSWASWERPYVDAGFALLDIQAGETYLEVGVGTGKLLARAAAASVSGTCVGIDLSSKMCERARRFCGRELGEGCVVEHVGAAVVAVVGADGGGSSVDDGPGRVAGRVQVVCGDAFNVLAETRMTFDAVAVCFTLELFEDEDMLRLLDQLRCRLTVRDDRGGGGGCGGGGRIVLVAMSEAAKGGCAMCCYRWIRGCCSKVVDCKPVDVAGLVRCVGGLEVTHRSVLPMYGLAVELVEARLSE